MGRADDRWHKSLGDWGWKLAKGCKRHWSEVHLVADKMNIHFTILVSLTLLAHLTQLEKLGKEELEKYFNVYVCKTDKDFIGRKK